MWVVAATRSPRRVGGLGGRVAFVGSGSLPARPTQPSTSHACTAARWVERFRERVAGRSAHEAGA